MQLETQSNKLSVLTEGLDVKLALPYMSILATITAFVKLLIAFFSARLEHNQRVRKKKEEAFNEIKQGIKDGDASRVTSGFDRLRR